VKLQINPLDSPLVSSASFPAGAIATWRAPSPPRGASRCTDGPSGPAIFSQRRSFTSCCGPTTPGSPPSGEQRQTLVGDLVGRIFTSYADVALAKATDRSKSGSEAFVDIDTGLAIMSQHARGLGYDGVILFLDELILLLATRAADVNFVSAEGAKLSKLVEAQRADRPIPIISFVARQRDLRDFGRRKPGRRAATSVRRYIEVLGGAI
jgi:hypothetical protein